MNSTVNQKSVVFVLGAGFNFDAASEAGNPIALSSGRPARYPLVSELLDICFHLREMPHGKSIEDLFQGSIDSGHRQPVDNLCASLMEADYYITPCLKSGGSHHDNVYVTFLHDFPESPLITFNYDSLPEILLLAERIWCPEDGYGVPVGAGRKIIQRGAQPVDKSLRPVLHLHGSLCVYPSTYYIERSPLPGPNMLRFDRGPDFIFDPDVLGNVFFPFERILPGVAYTYVGDRVIAPIPDKAEGLRGEFISAVYSEAVNFLSIARQVIFVGYSFNQADRFSYVNLLASVADRPMLIVAPEADFLVERLMREHPHIRCEAQSMSFKHWVGNGYPGAKI
jgi:hypothetical protein